MVNKFLDKFIDLMVIKTQRSIDESILQVAALRSRAMLTWATSGVQNKQLKSFLNLASAERKTNETSFCL
jgi:hypothetical protein